MNQDRTNRKLAAIFSTDVAGYSRMMEADEAWTIQNLEENKKLMSSLIEEYKGRVVDSPGDNLLAEFSSVINAVECAVKTQKELNKKNSRLTEEHQMKFRIGVNLGDVIEEDGKIYGNGVNIAARLEGLAEPGGICISHNAYDQVKNKIGVDYDYLGEYQVKNINEPVRVYRILMGGKSTENYVPYGGFRDNVIYFKKTIAVYAIILVVAIGVTIAFLNPKPSEPRQITRFFVELPEGYVFADYSSGSNLAIAPDGSQFAVSTTNGIYLRSMNEWNIKQIAGTMGNTRQPFFSPDGESIGYWSIDENQLKKVSVNGGNPVSLYKDDPCLGYYHWGTDGNIYYANGNGIMRVPENGGEQETVIISNDEAFFSPQLLPDGKSVIFTLDTDEGFKIAVQSLHLNNRKILFKGETALYLPTGHLIYIVNNDLNAVPFDINKLETTGRPVPVVRDILVTGPPHFCVSNSGTFAYLKNIYNNRSLVWVDFHGREEELDTVTPDIYKGPKISPDGDYIALSTTNDIGNSNIGILDIIRGNIVRLSQNMPYASYPIWSPDNQSIVFNGGPGDVFAGSIYWMLSSGTGEIRHLFKKPMQQILPESFSYDGKILLCQVRPASNSNITYLGILNIDDAPIWKLLLDDKYNKKHAKFSPNNEWIAYTSDISGQDEVYIRSFPGVDKIREQISTNGGYEPLWSPNSPQLFYRSGDRVISVTYETKKGFKVVESEILFKGAYLDSIVDEDLTWDIHPDGKRFLMMKETDTDSKGERIRPRIFIIENWFEELKEKVPVN